MSFIIPDCFTVYQWEENCTLHYGISPNDVDEKNYGSLIYKNLNDSGNPVEVIDFTSFIEYGKFLKQNKHKQIVTKHVFC